MKLLPGDFLILVSLLLALIFFFILGYIQSQFVVHPTINEHQQRHS